MLTVKAELPLKAVTDPAFKVPAPAAVSTVVPVYVFVPASVHLPAPCFSSESTFAPVKASLIFPPTVFAPAEVPSRVSVRGAPAAVTVAMLPFRARLPPLLITLVEPAPPVSEMVPPMTLLPDVLTIALFGLLVRRLKVPGSVMSLPPVVSSSSVAAVPTIVTVLVPAPSAPELLILTVPAVTETLPPKVLAPLRSVTPPAPAWVTVPVPEITLAKSVPCVSVFVRLKTSEAFVISALPGEREPVVPPLPICSVPPFTMVGPV